MRRFTTALVLLALLSMSTAKVAAGSLAILWDDTHDSAAEIVPDELSGQYSEFATYVVADGHSMVELDGIPGDLTAAVLDDYDVLMVFDAEAEFTIDEVTAIQDFVTAGGLLFVAGDRPGAFSRASHNSLLAPYGVTFTTVDLIDGTNLNPALDLSVFVADPLTAGLTAVDFFSSGTLAVVGPGTKVLGRTAAPGSHIGYAYGSNGAVVVIADADNWSNNLLSPGDNEERLLANLLGHFAALAAPTPTPTPSPTPAPPEPTATPTEMPTDTPEPTATPTVVPTDTPEPTATPTPLPPTATPTLPAPTATPTATPTSTPLPPTATPTPLPPTATPTPLPPTATATATPTPFPPTPTSTAQPTATTPAPIVVRIDVKPGDAINSINPKSNALLVVAILTTTVGDGGFTRVRSVGRHRRTHGQAGSRPGTGAGRAECSGRRFRRRHRHGVPLQDPADRSDVRDDEVGTHRQYLRWRLGYRLRLDRHGGVQVAPRHERDSVSE